MHLFRTIPALLVLTALIGCGGPYVSDPLPTATESGNALFSCSPSPFTMTAAPISGQPESLRYTVHGSLMMKPGYTQDFVPQPSLTADYRVYNLKLTPSNQPTIDMLQPIPVHLEFADKPDFKGLDIFVDNVWGAYASLDEYRVETISCRRNP